MDATEAIFACRSLPNSVSDDVIAAGLPCEQEISWTILCPERQDDDLGIPFRSFEDASCQAKTRRCLLAWPFEKVKESTDLTS
jgi:hypothetical protein